MKKLEIVKEYLKRFPNTPSWSLARKIYKEKGEFFKDIEDARSKLRYARGQRGKHNRESIKSKEFFASGLYKIPRSYAEKAKVFHIPQEDNNILVISDLHIPYHDIRAIETAVKYGKDHNINCIIINGDLVDFFMISRFVHLERKVSVKEELEAAKEFLAYLNQEFKVPIYFLCGNHELRLENYLATKAPELLDMEEFRLEFLLEAKKFNMKVFNDSTLIKAGKLAITHGHNLLRGFFSPVNVARGAFLKAKSSVMVSHMHKVSTHSETTINGKPITCYSTGCLCELNPRYSPFANNFTHGFAHVQFQTGGNFKVKNIQILDGEIVN